VKDYDYDAPNVVLASQENAFMRSSLFELCASKVFFPTIKTRRREFSDDRPAVLFRDGLGSYHTDTFLALCSDRNIRVIFLIPHASDQTQPLDFLTFSVMKQRFSASKFDRLTNLLSKKVMPILGMVRPKAPGTTRSRRS
jgi:hypothetical protein